MDLSIVIPALNEKGNIEMVLRETEAAARELRLDYEMIVVDGGSRDGTPEIAKSISDHVKVVHQREVGYGGALREGFQAAEGNFILTMDADFSHDPIFLSSFWNARNDAEMIIGSRYVPKGVAIMPFSRKMMSMALNQMFRRGLSVPCHDLSSGFRMYRSAAVQSLSLDSTNFDILQEILIRLYAQGFQITEIPIRYRPRESGSSHAKLIRFGIAYLRTFWAMWRLRNSIESADYDDRAYDSIIPLQRYWQRKRCSILDAFAVKEGLILDVGCGSSRILACPANMIGVDIQLNKLRYGRKFRRPLVNASIWSLPFRDHSFDCVICSEVVEHIPGGIQPFLELRRVLKPNGILVIGTPDYDHATWRMIEAAYRFIVPGGYADEHITRYSLASMKKLLNDLGFRVLDTKYIFNSEMILRCIQEQS